MNQINICIGSVDPEDTDALVIAWDPDLMRTFGIAANNSNAFYERAFHQSVKLARNLSTVCGTEVSGHLEVLGGLVVSAISSSVQEAEYRPVGGISS